MKLHSLQHSLFKNRSHFTENRLVFDEWDPEHRDDCKRAPASAPAVTKKADIWDDRGGEASDAVAPSAENLRNQIEEKVDDLEDKMNEIIDDFNDKYSITYKERIAALKGELMKIKDQIFLLNTTTPGASETLAKIDLHAFEKEIASPLLREDDPAELERELFALGKEIKEDYFNQADQVIKSFIEKNFGYVDGLHDKTHRGLKWIATLMRETRSGRAELIATVEEAQKTKDPKKFKEALDLLKKSNIGQVLTSFENFLNNSSLDAWNHYVVFIRKSLAATDRAGDADIQEISKMRISMQEELAAKALRGEGLTVADIEHYERELDAILNK